jgi:allantoinase
MSELVIRSERVVFTDGTRAATIRIRDGFVQGIGRHDEHVAGVPLVDAGTLVVLPGLVDTHVHINDPGRSDWEGFETATRAAAAGGVTTVVDMPLNSIPPTTTSAGLAAKRRAADGRCHVDVAFWGGVVPGNVGELQPLVEGGVLGFKCFLSPSGVEEFQHVGEHDLRLAMPTLAQLGLPLLVHAELPSRLFEPCGDPRSYATWLKSRPAEAEESAIDLVIALARQYGVHVHIVHLAAASALRSIAEARRAGTHITVETCPHYLAFAAEDIPSGATAFKCAPPIRGRAHRERLWQALVEGEIDFIATDHSPAPASLKHLDTGDFVRAWGGIASLQLGLGVVWTAGQSRGASFAELAQWLAENPARLAGIHRRKGAIAAGYDADFVVWDPDAKTVVDAAALYHRHPITPYHGAHFNGRVRTTILRGEIVFDDGDCRGRPSGRLITRAT